MKVAVIGVGSSYTPELVQGFLERFSSLPITQLWLMDIAPGRLQIVGGFARRIVQAKGAPFTVHLSTDQREAIRGARYVISQLRVGRMPARREDEYLGRRHGLIGWHRGFLLDGEEVWPLVLDSYVGRLKADPDPEWDPRTIEVLGMIPNPYLHYYYHTERMLVAQQQWPPSRAEEVMEIETELLRHYAEPDRTELPQGLMKHGGAYYSTSAIQLLHAHYNDLGETHVVNVRHEGAVSNWPGRIGTGQHETCCRT